MEYQIDKSVVMDQYRVMDGPEAFELYIEGMYSQLATNDDYDFKEYLAPKYTGQMKDLKGHLKAIS